MDDAAAGVVTPAVSTEGRRVPSSRRGPFPPPGALSQLKDLAAPHLASYDEMVGSGLAAAVADLAPREVRVRSGDVLSVWLEDVTVGTPVVSEGDTAETRRFPAECRELRLSYTAPLGGTLCRRLNGGPPARRRGRAGEGPGRGGRPRGRPRVRTAAPGEEAVEFGGYFICNGIERVVRMLQIPKRNYPHAITRSAYTNRGPLYSNKGIMMRCVRGDQSAVSLTLHYLTDGSATVRFALNRQEFFLPVIMVLKALVPTTDREIYERLLAGDTGNTYLSDRVLMLLRDAKRYESALHSQASALAYLGSRFRGILEMPPSLTDAAAGQALLDTFILVHLPADAARDKFALLLLMLRKLYAFVRGDVAEDNPDSLANHELLLSGHLLLMFLKEKLGDYLSGIKEMVEREDDLAARAASGSGRAAAALGRAGGAPPDLADATYLRRVIDRQADVGRKMQFLLATGNLVTKTGLDLMQVSGYTVVADKINFMRFTTHFRAVHRGQFFAEQKTTTVRKLLPENWGFLCPIHTPDGGPCGLLNHISAAAAVLAQPVSEPAYAALVERRAAPASAAAAKAPTDLLPALQAFLVSLGMTPYRATGAVPPHTDMPILLDGRVLGGAPPHTTYAISRALRRAKALSAGVVGGVDRVPEAPQTAGSREDVRALVRAAVRGLVDPDTVRRRGVGDADGGAARRAALAALPAPAVVLPPAMEVAFIPPPWWDAEVDPHLSLGEGAALASELGASRAAGGAAAGGAGADVKLTGLFAGLFLSTAPARLVRPIVQLDTGLVELVSPQEQPYLDVACTPEDVDVVLARSLPAAGEGEDGAAAPRPLLYTHIELSAMAMLSEVASLTPFSDLNQSPRNMYQCQMGKQTMGTPVHGWGHRPDSKLYRLQNPQAPLVQTAAQAEYGLDEYPSGANAVVAVIAYTGYDMEDACIVNKSSYERGFGHASVYKTLIFDLNEGKPAADAGRYVFHNAYLSGENAYRDPTQQAAKLELAGVAPPSGPPPRPRAGDAIAPSLDVDGLPAVGTLVRHEEPIYVVLDTTSGTHTIARHKELEPVYIDQVRVLSTPGGAGKASSGGVQKVAVTLRYNRNPVVGDKFSSRHGQKGVLSYLWPTTDMPFSDAGMVPDVIINPHAFPSRMTIGMLVESMAGKAGACGGAFQDATPFRFDETHRVVDYFGDQLRRAGYNYYGTETMYSGVTGEPLHAEIYLGVVYYQRLRHMVNDKSQVRSTGPINQLTRQPVKGRKKHGGIRFGEMERDSLLAHGASFLLRDRLHTSSDRHIALVCRACGSLLSTFSGPAAATKVAYGADGATPATSRLTFDAEAVARVHRARRAPVCLACGTGDHCVAVPMPYVFRYLANELAAMNIKIKLELGPGMYASIPGPTTAPVVAAHE